MVWWRQEVGHDRCTSFSHLDKILFILCILLMINLVSETSTHHESSVLVLQCLSQHWHLFTWKISVPGCVSLCVMFFKNGVQNHVTKTFVCLVSNGIDTIRNISCRLSVKEGLQLETSSFIGRKTQAVMKNLKIQIIPSHPFVVIFWTW